MNIQLFNDVTQFFSTSQEITGAKVDFAWFLAVERREHLKRFRNLSILSFGPNSRIETCEALDEIPTLTSVSLIGQHRLKDFSALTKLPRLTELRVTAAWQLDLKPLGEMYNLTSLLLDGPEKGYGVINNLENLIHLEMSCLKMKNLKCISNLHRLNRLEARAIPLHTLEGVPCQAPIEHLNVSQTLIDSVEPAVCLNQLKVLWMTKCKNIKEIKPTINMQNLREIYLNDNPNELDLSPLTECPKLEVLYFYGTEVTPESLKALSGMKQLKRCEFCQTHKNPPYSVKQIQSFAPECRFRIVLPRGEIYSTPL